MGKGKVLLGMSGGVDSSVSALLLTEKGYDVIGISMKLFDYSGRGINTQMGGCCGIDLIDDARLVCAKLNIPHYVLDFSEPFRKQVIDNFIVEYNRGRTPNPCIACNTYIKWGEMFDYAEKLECDYIATGHYARIIDDSGVYKLLRSRDKDKDQSYALWGIPSAALSRTIFPLGECSKKDVRKVALERHFRNADRPESQEICFVPDNDYAGALRRWSKSDSPAFQPGPVYNAAGEKLGEHKGLAHYTIGQRRGLGISSAEPLYVLKIKREDNSMIVGKDDELLAEKFTVSSVNLLIEARDVTERLTVKIRYKHQDSPATVDFFGDGMTVTFKDPQRAITPGQSAVFYSGDYVIGGGIIDEVIE
ncbi:MAG: tRNA 2-thiouridine(34) synthase MnmA [Candidatus Zixiibacteriota bacterium]|nr:MAG: tRNA 2-thiouridine(34) synthase MnmA [candidate division Zixibacteria bacterium]